MWVLVDVMQIQGQDVVLAAHVHAVMILIHTQDPVVGCVEEVGEVMSSTGGSQLCSGQKYTHDDSCGAYALLNTHGRTTDTFPVPLLGICVALSDGFPATLLQHNTTH